jgi:hypothetical protein
MRVAKKARPFRMSWFIELPKAGNDGRQSGDTARHGHPIRLAMQRSAYSDMLSMGLIQQQRSVRGEMPQAYSLCATFTLPTSKQGGS